MKFKQEIQLLYVNTSINMPTSRGSNYAEKPYKTSYAIMKYINWWNSRRYISKSKKCQCQSLNVTQSINIQRRASYCIKPLCISMLRGDFTTNYITWLIAFGVEGDNVVKHVHKMRRWKIIDSWQVGTRYGSKIWKPQWSSSTVSSCLFEVTTAI